LPFALRNLLKPKRFVFQSRQNEARNSQEKRSRIVQAAFVKAMETFSAIEFENGSSQNRAEPVAIWKARRFIEEHSSEELSLTKVAKAVSMNASHLSENFKQVTGINYVEYVARIRFEKARRFLNDGDRRISDIAFAAGFQSLSQFNRVFKKFSGSSPTQYRATKAIVRRYR
jgi:AraC-like DNA-binding protein